MDKKAGSSKMVLHRHGAIRRSSAFIDQIPREQEILCVYVNIYIYTYYHIITYMRMCRCVCALL